MRKHMTIRSGLVMTISLYTVLLVAVIVMGVLGLYRSNSALRAMYRDDTASVPHLKTSSERLLLLRSGFGEVEQLISAGKPAQRKSPRCTRCFGKATRNWNSGCGVMPWPRSNADHSPAGHARCGDVQSSSLPTTITLPSRCTAIVTPTDARPLVSDRYGWQNTAVPMFATAFQ